MTVDPPVQGPGATADTVHPPMNPAVQQTVASDNTVHAPMDQSDQTHQVNMPAASAKVTAVPLDKMKNIAAPGQPEYWSGYASEAKTGDIIRNIPYESYYQCVTNVTRHTLQKGVYVRQAYIDIYHKIKGRLQQVLNTDEDLERAIIHICGTPMIGKTMFLYYVLARLANDFKIPGFVIVGIIPGNKEVANSEKYYYSICKRINEKLLIFERDSTTFSPQASPFTPERLRGELDGYIFLIDNAKTDFWDVEIYNNTIIFASPKVDEGSKEAKVDINTWWMPVWNRTEIDDLLHKFPRALPRGKGFTDYENMAQDIGALMDYFGGTLGNILFRNRAKRSEVLEGKAEKLLTKEIIPGQLIAGVNSVLHEKYSSLIEVQVDKYYNKVGTNYISKHFTNHILQQVGIRKARSWNEFWGAPEANAVARGEHYEAILASYLGKNTELDMDYQPHIKRKVKANFPPTQNLLKTMKFKFENGLYHQTRKGPYCVEVQRLVRMWPKCAAVDFYTIQKRKAKNDRQGDDVTDQLSGTGHPIVADGCTEGYDVIWKQASYGKIHKMNFKTVASRSVDVEKEVVKVIADPNLQATLNGKHMKNSLLSGSVSIYLCYIQPVVNDEFSAPGEEEIEIESPEKEPTTDDKLRDAIMSKLQVIYGVADPIHVLCGD